MSPGTRCGRFEIQAGEGGAVHELSRDALGVTYLARDLESGNAVALSVIEPGIFASEAARNAAVEAAKQAIALRQLHAAAVLDAGVSDGEEMYHAAEPCEGTNVQGMVVEEGALSALQAVGLAAQVCMALAAAESQGLAHGSLSPEKLVLIMDEEGDTMVKVTGFGLPSPFAPGIHPSGEPAAMADLSSFVSPEQWQGQSASIAGDLYALGACLWFMLTGQAPLEGAVTHVKSQALAGTLPWERLAGQQEPLVALMRSLLVVDAGQRPRAAEALQELQECFASLAAAESATAGAQDAADTASFQQRFSLESDLGAAPMGHLYRAVDTLRPEAMATVLEVDPKFTATALMRQNLEDQLDAAQRNPSRGWSVPLDFTWTSEGLVIATDWQEGVTLRGVLTQRGWLPPVEALPLLELLAAIADEASERGVIGLNLSPQEIQFHAAPSAGLVNWATLLNLPLREWPQCGIVAGSLSVAGKFNPVAAIGRLACEMMGGVDATLQASIPGLGEPAHLLLRKSAAAPSSFASAATLVSQLRQEFLRQPAAASPVMDPAVVAASFPRSPRKKERAPVALIASLGLITVITLGAGYYISHRNDSQASLPGPHISSPISVKPVKPAEPEEDLSALIPQDGVESDPNSPMAKIVQQAVKGDAYSQALLGWELVSSPGASPQKIEIGRKWLQKSAEQDHPLGLYLTAEQEWQDLRPNPEEVLPFRLSSKFSEAGLHGFRTQVTGDDYVWQAALGRAFYYGLGMRKDADEAKRWFTKAAKGGDVPTLLMLAKSLSAEVTRKSSIQAALGLYAQAARKGNAQAVGEFARLAGIFPVPWKDMEGAGTWIAREANAGSATGEFLMGRWLEDGASAPPDPKAALEWYRKSSEERCPQGMVRLGLAYQNREAPSPDPDMPFRLYEQARQAGAIEAYAILGIHYIIDAQTPGEGKKAIDLLRAGSEAGDPRAIRAYAIELNAGRFVQQDQAKAAQMLTGLAEDGDPQAMYDLSSYYYFGRGVAENERKYWSLLFGAAQLGNKDALYDVGFAYEHGQTVERDLRAALEYYGKAIEKGDDHAHLSYGYMLEMGEGTPKDLAGALKHYRAGANMGDLACCVNLGLMYARGEGVPKDDAKAVELYEKAAEAEDKDALVLLGMMHEYGRGVPKDRKKAAECYQRAADEGDEEAAQRLKRVSP